MLGRPPTGTTSGGVRALSGTAGYNKVLSEVKVLLRLQKVVIENYKGIERAELEPARDVTLIIGINGAGKTSLVEAIRLLGELTQGSDTRWLKMLFATRSREGFVGCLPWREPTREMAWTVTAIMEDDSEVEYRLTLAANPVGDPTVAKEEFRLNGEVQVRWDPKQSAWVSGEQILMGMVPPRLSEDLVIGRTGQRLYSYSMTIRGTRSPRRLRRSDRATCPAFRYASFLSPICMRGSRTC